MGHPVGGSAQKRGSANGDGRQRCNDAPVRTVRTGQPVPVAPTSRQATARRLQAARVLAGRPALQDLARRTGMSCAHLRAVANAQEPMTFTDACDLATALDVPVQWLRDGWSA
jgi:hypothetical protein